MENTNDAPTTFNMIIAADNDFKGVPGYSDISVPEIFRSSAAGCSVSSGPVGITDKITGGADKSIYRVLTLTLPAKGTCQVEWYNTVALGASEIPGKSLQAYVFDQNDFKGGKRTISLGVDLSQKLSKTMSAVQGSNHNWTVTKNASPSTVTLDTCKPEGTQATVDVKVTWTKAAASPGDVTITTTITAKNAAARAVKVKVNDKIYQGTGTTTLIDDWTSDVVTVPAKGSHDFVHTYTWKQRPQNVTQLNDVATATYLDPNGQPYAGTTTAKASTTIKDAPPTNATARIDDSEKLVGDPLPTGMVFSSQNPSPVAGSFLDGYTAGTKTVGPVKWTSGSRSNSGDTTFPKTIYVEKGTVGAAQLVDTATLNGSDGLKTTADAAVDVIVQTNATLTITKTVPDILTGEESATFTFDVLDDQGALVADDVPITFTAGQTEQSTSVGGLSPAQYTVQENEVPAGWDPAPEPQVVDLTGSTCTGTAGFTNSVTNATATAVKVTDPAGSEGGWEMTLTPAGGEPRTVVTDSAGQAAFGELAEGSYTITETMQSGWEFAGQTGDCEFTVDYPRDAGKAFTCTLRNNQLPPPPPVESGALRIVKEFNPQTSGFTGSFNVGYACVQGTTVVKSGIVALGDGQSETINGLPLGTSCLVTEQTLPTPPTGWTFNQPAYAPESGEVSITADGQTVEVRVINSISQVNPVVNKRVCPIEPMLVKKIKKSGNRILIKKIKTNKSSCVLLKPVVLCKPLGSAAAGETAFCDIKATTRGRVTVNTKGYDAVKVTVVVRTKPKPGFADRWKPNTWRKSWILR